ncbi:hypothetical protein AA0473_2349 [Acetobacter orleanensis NRIC 0473]|uniref:Uncharacterized protein n=1 Tax=Acetobacter orleanensis TaxID=104099 RepID=A0A4Y3TIS9_9PROT|nr:hypothetical protein Abol_024_053 [Acetobacter orleanensis JCM 7639]GBR30748.1 hypothetical protein AA0473_2349 [Acetobacter orleanensis NRIC 0473]GEB81678.1 hypothetical protein AOR01nite_01550 [Acetobacter orleanensis]
MLRRSISGTRPSILIERDRSGHYDAYPQTEAGCGNMDRVAISLTSKEATAHCAMRYGTILLYDRETGPI